VGGDSLRQEQWREQQVRRDVSGQSTYQVLQQQQRPSDAGYYAGQKYVNYATQQKPQAGWKIPIGWQSAFKIPSPIPSFGFQPTSKDPYKINIPTPQQTVEQAAITVGILSGVMAPVAAGVGAAAGAASQTVWTGVMEKRLPTVEETVTAAGFSAAASTAAGPLVSKMPLPKILTEPGLTGVAARVGTSSAFSAGLGAASAAVSGKDVVRGAVAGALAGAAGAAAGEAAFRGFRWVEERLIGVRAYRVRGAESYEVTRETEEAVGGSRITKVETEPTRISKEQAELLRYTQIEELKMAGTADTILKGGSEVVKGYGKPFETSYMGEAAEDIMQTASRGGGIVTETVYMEKAPGSWQFRLAEYEAATAKLTGVQAFGKIDPQVYLRFLKVVPPEVAGEWLTQMGGVSVSQLSQISSPISIVMHDVFALPTAIPAGVVAGEIAGAAAGIMPEIGKVPSKVPIMSPTVTNLPEEAQKLERIRGVTPKWIDQEKTTPIIEPKPDFTPQEVLVQRLRRGIFPKWIDWEETVPIIRLEPEETQRETPIIKQIEWGKTLTITPTPTPIRQTAVLRPSHERREGVRAPDFGRLLFGGKYVKRHQIALPSQVSKQILTVSARGRGKRGSGGAGLGGISLGGSLGMLVFGGGKRKSGKASLLRGSLAEVVFG
jgi:hypothetical protein